MTDRSRQAQPDEWEVWTSALDGATTWWATRNRLLTESEMREGKVHTLRAETEDGLRALLNEQSPRPTGGAAAPHPAIETGAKS
ncbi:hypothetical protein E1287_34705 [Actinomadura sp. KC06]|uniref:hypothetical protein n=1 Tax=Actinomadura sp. KC06 TaxID=2530369 RepID=UPI00104DDDD9|nr:hypothetical protein [Actinomadura sp. KC06]TDD27369.1 hypothetical protein E1287_34705 [Actinomadura sp. KC06]